MSGTFLLLFAGGFISMGLLQAMETHPLMALANFVIAAACIVLTRWVR